MPQGTSATRLIKRPYIAVLAIVALILVVVVSRVAGLWGTGSASLSSSAVASRNIEGNVPKASKPIAAAQAGSRPDTSKPAKGILAANLGEPPGPLSAIAGQTYPLKNLDAQFSELAEKAKNGDVIAARTLAHALQVCSNVPKTLDELDSATASATRPNLAPNWVEVMQKDLDYKQSLFAQCSGTTPTEVATRPEWIGILAKSGDAEARLQYVSVARPTDLMAADYEQQLATYRQNAADYIQSEIDLGNPRGLLTMGLQYDAPTGVEGISPLYPADPQKAYSYFYAYSLAAPNDNESAVSILAVLANQLTPAQVQSAVDSGTLIYTKCCKR